MTITELSLRRPVTVVMIFLSFAAVGLIAARLLPLEYLPDIEFPGAFIQVPYQGSTPEEVEREITRPIEEGLSTLTGIKRMRSTSNQDGAQINLFFGWGEDAGVKGIQVLDRLDAIRGQLPDDVDRIFVFKGSTSDTPIMQIRLSSHRDLSDAYEMLDRNVRRRLERIDGVAQVRLEGVEQRQIRIKLDARRLTAHHIAINDISNKLRQNNFSVTAGHITDPNGQRLMVHPVGEYQSVDQIRNVIIDHGVRLKDVADVDYESPERNYGRHLDRHYAIGLTVFKETGANMVEVGERVQAEIDKIAKLPQMEGIRIFFLDNQAQGVKDSLSDLLSSGLIGAGLSLIVLYFFLRQVTTTLMVTLAVPFSIFISLAVMYFSGITLNILSMMGLMLAVGMLVDNAVVITENIFRHKKMDPSRPREATIRGTREVLLAVTAGTLTTVIVFVPNIFGVQNNITVFLKHVAISIVVALLASLLISVTMIPMIASRIHARPPEKGGTVIDRFKVRYRRLLEWTLQRRWLAIIGILVVLGSVVVPGAAVKKDMFPNDNNNRRLFLSYNVNSTYTLDKVESAVSKIENYLYANKKKFEITSVYSYFEPARAESTILLDDGPDAKKSDAQIMEEIRKGLPKLAIAKPSFDEKRTGSNEGVRVQIKGKSSEVLARMSHDVARALGTIDGLVDVHSEATAGQEEVQVTVDRDRAILYGLDTRQIAQAIAVAMRGQNLRHFRGRDGEIPIHLEFRKGDRDSLSKLEQLPLYTSSGDRIPLSAVAKLEVRSGPTAIQRENRVTAIGITAGLKDGATMDSVKPKIRQVMDELRMPPGYSWDFGQGFQQEDETASVMLTNMLLAVLLIYIVMAALFEAVLHPLAIISSIIFSIIGVFWFFLVTNTTFSFMAMIGILILMGVVVNNGIVMVDHINNLRREGHDRRHAILQACEDRLQPILMTVCTTILGLIPLAIGNTQVGGDGPPYFPMARAIIGGLAFSTLVSLVMLPTIYCLVDDLGLWATELWRRARGGHAEPARESASGK